MADYLSKFILTADTPQTIDNLSNFVAFDFTNDSPFDVDVQWGLGKPVALTIPPTTMWRGASPASALLIPGNQWGGRIVVTPSYPGGGNPPVNAPAMQLTIHGYERGNQPAEQVMNLNRLQNLGNTVPIGTTATKVADLLDAAGTMFIEGAVNGTDHVQGFNDGFIGLLKDATSADQNLFALIDLAVGGHNWEFFLKTGASHGLAIEDLTAGITALLLASDGSATIVNKLSNTKALGGANQAYFEAAPADGLTWDISELSADHGLAFVQGTTQFEIHPTKGIKPRNEGFFISGVSEFVGTVTGVYNHNLGTTPDAVIPMQSSVGSQTMGFDTLGATTVHVTSGAGNVFTALAYQLNS